MEEALSRPPENRLLSTIGLRSAGFIDFDLAAGLFLIGFGSYALFGGRGGESRDSVDELSLIRKTPLPDDNCSLLSLSLVVENGLGDDDFMLTDGDCLAGFVGGGCLSPSVRSTACGNERGTFCLALVGVLSFGSAV